MLKLCFNVPQFCHGHKGLLGLVLWSVRVAKSWTSPVPNLISPEDACVPALRVHKATSKLSSTSRKQGKSRNYQRGWEIHFSKCSQMHPKKVKDGINEYTVADWSVIILMCIVYCSQRWLIFYVDTTVQQSDASRGSFNRRFGARRCPHQAAKSRWSSPGYSLQTWSHWGEATGGCIRQKTQG